MREWSHEEESKSPTTCTDSSFCMMIIEAKERQDVMTADAPNAFIQTEIDTEKGKEKMVRKLKGMSVEMLIEDISDVHSDHVACKNGQKVSHAQVL